LNFGFAFIGLMTVEDVDWIALLAKV
jgi:hypothetical protein